jgi:hypothetical protein
MSADSTPNGHDWAFWKLVRMSHPDECWIWIGHLQQGYGRLMRGKRNLRAHRYAYELIRGPIPVGMTLDHLCRNRACVNPRHLEIVTHGENSRRGGQHRRQSKLPAGSAGN